MSRINGAGGDELSLHGLFAEEQVDHYTQAGMFAGIFRRLTRRT